MNNGGCSRRWARKGGKSLRPSLVAPVSGSTSNGLVKADDVVWEYELQQTTRSIEDQAAILTAFGEHGWEAIGVYFWSDGATFYFKRPRQS